MKFLLTNDDGIDAPGLEALVSAARTLGEPVVVAPAGPQSGVSHAVTWHGGVRIEPRGDERYAIHGTPADCTRLGLLRVVPDAKWVLSGINHGANLGADMYYSGTVAAVREAVLHGWPGIAVSHYRKSGVEFDWARAVKWVTPILTEIVGETDRARPFLQCESADSSGRSQRSGGGLVSARSKPVAAQLSPRRRKRTFLCRRLPTPSSQTGSGCGYLFRRPHRRDCGSATVTRFSRKPIPYRAENGAEGDERTAPQSAMRYR